MEAFSIVVRTLMACCVTILDLARLGSGVYVVGAFCVRWGRNCTNSASSSTRLIGGTCPGALFLVTRRCDLDVCLRTRLDVRFRACRIGSAFVIRGIVMMGVLSITLCCCSSSEGSGVVTLCLSTATLCSSTFGERIFLMFAWSNLISLRPLGVLAALAVSS